MSARSLIFLAGATVLVVLAVIWLGRDRDAGTVPELGSRLVPELAEQVNDIDALDVVGPGERIEVRLRRDRDRWRVVEEDDYEADFEIVHELLRNLAELRRADARTSNSEYFARLGVADLDGEQASGVRLDFPGTELPGIIIGHTDPTGQGRFVRLAGESQTWISDRSLTVPETALDWLERSVMDIPPGEIAEIIIRHPDGDTVRLRSAGPDSDRFVLLDVPEGREAGQAWTRSSIANGLSRLRLDGVRRHAPPLPDDAVRALFTTHDGLDFVASLFADDDGHWIHFTVSADNGMQTDADDENETEPAGDDRERLIDAVAVDARLSPWEFKISERRHEDLTRRLEDLLADPE